MSTSSSDESFDSYAASPSGSLTDSSIDQSWLDESRDPENEQKFSLVIETDPKNTICINLTITKLDVNILIDTGAARSFISENFYLNIDEPLSSRMLNVLNVQYVRKR